MRQSREGKSRQKETTRSRDRIYTRNGGRERKTEKYGMEKSAGGDFNN